MKKVLSLVFVGAMLTLAACSSKPKTEGADSTAVSADTAMVAPADTTAATDTTAAADTTAK